MIAACRRAEARFSVTAKMDTKIKPAITAIPESAWTAIKYPNAISSRRRHRTDLRRSDRRAARAPAIRGLRRQRSMAHLHSHHSQPASRRRGTLASAFHARARGATLHRHLIAVPARIARHGRGHLTMHLPEHWPWAHAWQAVFNTVHPPPTAAV